jgi:putative membrane protein
MAKFNLNDSDKQKITDAVASLEKESSGEIVTYFSTKSDDYSSAKWLSALLIMTANTFIIAVFGYLWLLPGSVGAPETSIVILISGVIGYLLAHFVSPFKLLFVSNEQAYEKVRLRAIEAFLSEEIFKTRDRTGILFYISLAEHQIIVLADSGINAKVEQEDWNNVVDLIKNGIKQNNTADGLVQAIDSCKNLLLKNGFIVRHDDTNELSDEIRMDD